MKTAKERAMDIVYELIGPGFSRGMFEQMAHDASDMGKQIRRMLDAIERGIEADRKQVAAVRAPS